MSDMLTDKDTQSIHHNDQRRQQNRIRMKSISRKLFGAPVLLQDWDMEAEELSAKYWELFLDLLLVGAAASIANNLIAKQSLEALGEFTVLYLVTVNGWNLYSHHYTSRFEDGSLVHSLLLFPFLMGTAIAIVNSNYDTAPAFCSGAALQRVTFLVILAGVYHHIERGRALCMHLGVITLMATVFFSVGVAFPNLAIPAMWLGAAVETFSEFIMVHTLKGRRLLPINIEHTKDRLGCLILVMLGETVVSATISNHAISSSAVVDRARYYTIMGLSFLLIFMFTLLFFHMQPPPRDHAFRRDRTRGCFLLLSHKLLGLALVAVGVSVRLMVNATMMGTNLTDFTVVLTGCSVGMSLLLLLFIRFLHYGGVLPRQHDPPAIVRLMQLWWVVFFVIALTPFVLLLANITDPILSAAVNSGLIFALCLIESTFTHILEPYLSPDYVAPTAPPETEALRHSLPTTSTEYQSIVPAVAKEIS